MASPVFAMFRGATKLDTFLEFALLTAWALLAGLWRSSFVSAPHLWGRAFLTASVSSVRLKTFSCHLAGRVVRPFLFKDL